MRKSVKNMIALVLAFAFAVGAFVTPTCAKEDERAPKNDTEPTVGVLSEEEPTDYFIDEFDMTDTATTTSRNYHGKKMKLRVKVTPEDPDNFTYMQVMVNIVGFPKEYIFTVPTNGTVKESDALLIGFEPGNYTVSITFLAKGNYHVYLESYSWS